MSLFNLSLLSLMFLSGLVVVIGDSFVVLVLIRATQRFSRREEERFNQAMAASASAPAAEMSSGSAGQAAPVASPAQHGDSA